MARKAREKFLTTSSSFLVYWQWCNNDGFQKVTCLEHNIGT